LHLSVTLFVCLFPTAYSSAVIFTKLHIHVGTGPGMNQLNFESQLLLDQYSGLFVARWVIFQYFCLYMYDLCKNLSDLHENFVTDMSLDKDVPIKFLNSSGSRLQIQPPDLDSESRCWTRTTFALVDWICSQFE